jgi:hypothetical protein
MADRELTVSGRQAKYAELLAAGHDPEVARFYAFELWRGTPGRRGCSADDQEPAAASRHSGGGPMAPKRDPRYADDARQDRERTQAARWRFGRHAAPKGSGARAQLDAAPAPQPRRSFEAGAAPILRRSFTVT